MLFSSREIREIDSAVRALEWEFVFSLVPGGVLFCGSVEFTMMYYYSVCRAPWSSHRRHRSFSKPKLQRKSLHSSNVCLSSYSSDAYC